ncbi:ly6/PLAUR domain-containing protein 6-like [Asterias rubens]|uniref:ly6/PLAUR domain-containing protein 6-like n=1 Tax=Asterias rubens TaxID=7604 RepID=UPI001454E662|nr:ly6/PLAUR domain-containing protein 6-like [Asterias rubens]XP_033640058.1 ly6/PLAUR domain-containing protein 6-like [Asterias rubens]
MLLSWPLGIKQWLSPVLFYVVLMSTCSAPTEPTLIFSYDDSTPFPNAIKCFTCTDKKSNRECNERAYDAFCPKGTKYCYSSHYLNQKSGESILVNKKCALQEECTVNAVGCKDTSTKHVQRCVSCCEGTQCNFWSPHNSTTAVFSTVTPLNSAPQHTIPNVILIVTLTLLTRLLTLAT